MDYEDLVKEIKNCPTTWVPGLLINVVERAVEKKVFNPGKLVEVVQRVEKYSKEK